MRGLAIVLVVSSLLGISEETRTMAADPVRLIFDTDIGNDVDDVLALGRDPRACRVAGNASCWPSRSRKTIRWAAELVDAVNTFYGRGDIPIGVVHSGITNDEGKFLKLARVQDDGKLRFPHDLDGTRAAGRDGRVAEGAQPTTRPVGDDRAGRLFDEPGAVAGLAAGRHQSAERT